VCVCVCVCTVHCKRKSVACVSLREAQSCVREAACFVRVCVSDSERDTVSSASHSERGRVLCEHSEKPRELCAHSERGRVCL